MNPNILEQAAPFDRSAMWRAWNWCAAIYVALSGVCWCIPNLPSSILERAGHVVLLAWLLGPPVLLVYREGYLWVYLPATIVLAAVTLAGAESVRRLSAWSLAFAGVAVALWLACGFMVYAPGV